MFILIAIGLFDRQWDRSRILWESYVFVLISSTILGYAFIHVIPRYLTPLLPLFIIWTSVGIVKFSEWFNETIAEIVSIKKINEKIISAFIIALIVMSFAPKYIRSLEGDFYRNEVVYKTMGNWIKKNVGKKLTVMSLKPMTAFYSEGEHVYIPWADYRKTINYARRKGVDVIAVDEKAMRMKRPTLMPLLDEIKVSDDLEPVYISGVKDRIIIYKFK
jgi:hypothetical protein